MRVDRVVYINDRASLEHALKILDHRITFQDNMECVILTIEDSGPADTEFTVLHDLQKTPTLYLYNIDAAGIVYDSRRDDWDAREMFLRCSLANCRITLFVL